VFGYILISIVTLLQVYVFWRAASIPMFQNHQLLLTGAGIFLWLLFVSGRIFGHGGTGDIGMVAGSSRHALDDRAVPALCLSSRG